ncbi:hypothetical protein [Cellulomonas denverensis]|uniref:Uncharacterized protein n=1 Tax=Cellulomonas denverensis TaxID=264297 RepID=A0A7X6KX85_9CELL|nr:hypothetical protein [Cellulomonas denverensis]NKY23867.1 hypothetical protein [Cellulomonas denverensis]GIG27125.1 hypothetical protein Cde04nite_33690 [Cellulomonas denverensis]
MSHDHPVDPSIDDLTALTDAASDTFSVRRVFGEAYQQDGALVIPVALVTGAHARAAAGGRGRLSDGRRGPQHDPEPDTTPEDGADPQDGPAPADGPRPGPWGHHRHPHGHPRGGRANGMGRAGAGAFGTQIRPLGVYVVRDGDVSWQPAMDLNRVILGGQIVGALVGTALAVTLPIVSLLRRRS